MNRITRILSLGIVLAVTGPAYPQRLQTWGLNELPPQWIENNVQPPWVVRQTQRPWMVVTMDEDEFTPETVYVTAGTVIVWANTGYDVHTVEADVIGFGPNSDLVFRNGFAPGYFYYWVVPAYRSGTVIYYHCDYHGIAGGGRRLGFGMTGRIIVQ